MTKPTTDFSKKLTKIIDESFPDVLDGHVHHPNIYVAKYEIIEAVSELVKECKPNAKCIDKTIEGFAKSFVDEYEANLLKALGAGSKATERN